MDEQAGHEPEMADDDFVEKTMGTGSGLKADSQLEEVPLCGPCDEENSKGPIILRGPYTPSADEVATHNLTHLPFRSWCPHCAATRKSNLPHRTSKSKSTIPLLTADYCYVRESADQDLLTCLVARVHPWKMTFSFVVDMKGRDEAAITRLASFVKSCGLTQFAYRCDQEPALIALMEEAILKSGRDG